ncbi:acyltransferase [Vibrio tubiashii]|uniref:acyltransferase family protein n=1 Tax=Vibrio tubiashii TaxID=29498 RepID=UPI00234EACE4|nr:acyltransferase [Vibrio tubiashii]WCP69981.1 acyltransferase [Vibrio tubiashii]
MNLRRLPELDALRGIAALMVVLYHFLIRYEQIYPTGNTPLTFFEVGEYGVHVFFGISGFVIAWSLVRINDATDFCIARAARLYPPYAVAVLVTFSAVSLFGLPGREVSILDALLNLTLFHQYWSIPSVDGVYWTLLIEAQFYFWVTMILLVNKNLNLFRCFSLIFILGAALNLALPEFIVSKIISKLFFISYLAYFLVGMFFFDIYKSKKLNTANLTLLVACAGLQALLHEIAVFMFVSFVFLLLVFDKLKVVNQGIFLWLGSISYSLYLTHQNLGYIIINKLIVVGLNYYLTVAFAIFLTLIVAHVLYKCIEGPGRTLMKSALEQAQANLRLKSGREASCQK